MQFVNFYWIMFTIFGCHSINIQKTKKINYRLIAVVWSFKKSENPVLQIMQSISYKYWLLLYLITWK